MDIIIEVENETVVRNLQPNMNILNKIHTDRGFIITAKGIDYDFVSRFFVPSSVIPEDPVTGSAHCCLVPYWSKKLNKTDLKAYQASKRGGELFLKSCGNRVCISGKAITVMICELKI